MNTDPILESVSVRVVEQGFIGTCSYKSQQSQTGDYIYTPSEEYALADRAAVIDFLDKNLAFSCDCCFDGDCGCPTNDASACSCGANCTQCAAADCESMGMNAGMNSTIRGALGR
jgi:hypothetical protein